MADVADSKAESGSNNAQKKRPDGLDVDQYKNLEKWSYREWAWAFLRRNKKFIDACEVVKTGSEEKKQAVAQAFGLKKFKYFAEGYKGKSGVPRFYIGSISSWTNLEPSKQEPRQLKIKQDFGQVLIRFDLKSAIKDKKSLEKQLNLANKRLEKRLATFEAMLKTKAGVHSPKAETFGRYIRILDHLAAGKSRVECAKLIYPEDAKEFDLGNRKRFEMNNLIKNPLKVAKEYANERYLFLSLIGGRPEVSDIPLTAITSRADE